ncbi:uncharacterized protein DUF3139 [Bacillus oleivorans]|uniref:Uncharacterized protein DUF3139 n=1 Tax=Bacillus oleivorans TaxID=1448271 RepID=A0A285D5R4_9BACI|nr:DUF3139 domain-containing protein [Bacillus oleivorans]SNX75150.1 uncharacterized protein DUF3139 [Bacillus oleivorans]
MKYIGAVIGIILIIGYVTGKMEIFNGSSEEQTIETVLDYLSEDGLDENIKEYKTTYDRDYRDFLMEVKFKNEPFYTYIYFINDVGGAELGEIRQIDVGRLKRGEIQQGTIYEGKNGSVSKKYQGPGGFRDPAYIPEDWDEKRT